MLEGRDGTGTPRDVSAVPRAVWGLGGSGRHPERAPRQVVSFYSRTGGAADDNRLLLKANSLLPRDIRVMRLAAAPPDFIARFSNVGKVRARAQAAAQPAPPRAPTAVGASAGAGSAARCMWPLGVVSPVMPRA